jgi:hypothetical protein
MYAFKFSRGQIQCIGHYSEDGEKLRKLIFPANYNETKMFWIINANHAYGGRSGLLPLLVLIIKGNFRHKISPSSIFPDQCSNSEICKNKKFKISRLFNLLRNGKKFDVKFITSVNN